jgi:hypothetical protein
MILKKLHMRQIPTSGTLESVRRALEMVLSPWTSGNERDRSLKWADLGYLKALITSAK